MCSASGCQQRFTHANRHCPDHPYDQLKRCDDFIIPSVSEQNTDIIKWLEKYRMEKEDRTPTRKTPKRSKQITNTESNNENVSSAEYSSFLTSPSTPNNPYKSRKGLMVELDMNAGLEASPIAPKIKAIPKIIQWNEPQSQEEDSGDEFEVPAQSTFNPKKKWLREAWQDDLARPLEQIQPSTTVAGSSVSTLSTDYDEKIIQTCEKPLINSQIVSAPSQQSLNRFINPNEMRPTVLMVASKDRTMPLKTTDNEHNCGNNTFVCSTTDRYESEPYYNATNKLDSHYNISKNNLNAHLNGTTGTRTNIHDNDVPSYNNHNKNNYKEAATVINGYTSTTTLDSPSNGNRKWLGALALMQLASENDNINTIEDHHHHHQSVMPITINDSHVLNTKESASPIIRTINTPMVSNSDSFTKHNIYSNISSKIAFKT